MRRLVVTVFMLLASALLVLNTAACNPAPDAPAADDPAADSPAADDTADGAAGGETPQAEAPQAEAPVAEAPPPQGALPINVKITCDGENVAEFSINPYTATLYKTGNGPRQANFRLVATSDVQTVQVVDKGGDWPFENPPPTFGSGTNSAGTGPLRDDAAEKVYEYGFRLTCGAVEDTIDPRMDIQP